MEVSYNQKPVAPCPPRKAMVFSRRFVGEFTSIYSAKIPVPSLRSATPGPSPRTVFSATKPSDLFQIIGPQSTMGYWFSRLEKLGARWPVIFRVLFHLLGEETMDIVFFPNCVASGSKFCCLLRGGRIHRVSCAGDGRQIFFTLFFPSSFSKGGLR